ncbi:MAG: iron-containing redox enzyme family protein, partial [Nitrospinota bacterium]|nr:iron-containing redox enzyme family protein [Nitrospinota bacterium]
MHLKFNSAVEISDINFQDVERQFTRLLHLDDLEKRIIEQPELKEEFEDTLEYALSEALDEEECDSPAHLFLQRILYRINRLKLFWYDDLKNYANEDSQYLFEIQKRIESTWQDWESNHIDIRLLSTVMEVRIALRHRVAEDLDPKPSAESLYFRNEMTETGYRRLLAITSLDGLVEASQLSRVLGGASNKVQAMLTKIFLEEYGNAKLSRKHSSFFSAMLEEFEMKTNPEAYFDWAPWEVLANINHSFFLCERKRNFLRYIGSLLYFEVSVPAAFKNYQLAGERLGLSPEAIDYWKVHIKEDERHGQWMLQDVALPLVDRYPELAGEIVWGYDQQRFISARASQAIARSARKAENDSSS